MSQPIGSGYPDYARLSSQSDVLVVRQNTNIANLTTLGPFYVGNVPYMDMHVHPTGASALVRLTFFQDQALTNALSTDGMVARPAMDGRITVPVGGPWVSVSIQLSAYPNNPGFDLIAVGAPSMHTGVDGSEGILFGDFGVAIANGAVVTLTAPRVRAGLASFSGTTGAPTYIFELYALDFFGVATYLAEFNQVAGRRPYLVTVPAMPLQVIIRNGALNTVYNVGLNMRPLAGGA